MTLPAAPSAMASFGMPKHHRARLVLRDRSAPGVFISASPRAPSSPMPVMMMPSALRAGESRRRAEQHIDRGPMPRHQRAVLDRDVIARAAALQQHVLVAGRDQHAAAQHGVAIRRFLHLHCAQTVEPPGERLGEFLRHVLHDDDARASAGNASSTTRSDSVPPVEAPMQTTVSVVRAIACPATGGGKMTSAVSFGCGSRPVRVGAAGGAAAARAPPPSPRRRCGCVDSCRNCRRVDPRLQDDVDRAGLQRLHQRRPSRPRSARST